MKYKLLLALLAFSITITAISQRPLAQIDTTSGETDWGKAFTTRVKGNLVIAGVDDVRVGTFRVSKNKDGNTLIRMYGAYNVNVAEAKLDTIDGEQHWRVRTLHGDKYLILYDKTKPYQSLFDVVLNLGLFNNPLRKQQ